MTTSKYSLVAVLFNENSRVFTKSGQLPSYSLFQGVNAAHSTSSKRKLSDENDLNMGHKIINQIFTERESPQSYGPLILENLATAVQNFGKLRLKINK